MEVDSEIYDGWLCTAPNWGQQSLYLTHQTRSATPLNMKLGWTQSLSGSLQEEIPCPRPEPNRNYSDVQALAKSLPSLRYPGSLQAANNKQLRNLAIYFRA